MENCTQLLINQVMHLCLQRSMYLFRNMNMHPGKAGTLWALNQKDGLSQKDLAKKMGITPPSIAVMIKKLEAEGLIEKHQDKNDQRRTRIYITEEGKEIARYMEKVLNQMEEEACANMSEEEIMLLRRLLLQMKENLIKEKKQIPISKEIFRQEKELELQERRQH